MVILRVPRLTDRIIEKAIIELDQGEQVGFKSVDLSSSGRKMEQEEWFKVMTKKGYQLYRVEYEGIDYIYIFRSIKLCVDQN